MGETRLFITYGVVGEADRSARAWLAVKFSLSSNSRIELLPDPSIRITVEPVSEPESISVSGCVEKLPLLTV